MPRPRPPDYRRAVTDPGHAALDAAIAGDDRDHGDASMAVRVARVRLGVGAMPALAEVQRSPDASLAAALMARDALAGLDVLAQAQAATLASSMARSERERIEGELASAWSAHLRGEPVREPARALEARASRARLAHAVIDAATLSASAALLDGDLVVATSQARRASRMARTEGLPHEEYLAHLVLARVRRHSGRPHLATRIVTAIARVAPPRWRSWLAIELALSGAPDTAHRLAQRGIDGPMGESLPPLFSPLRAENVARSLAMLRVIAPLAVELEAWRAALDPSAPAPDAVEPFLAGRAPEVPGVLAGALGAAGDFRVRAWPGGAARRVLVASGARTEGIVEIGREAGAKQHRREAALVALALAGPAGLAKEELFRLVWGFQFAAHLHQGVLDVLLHRVRAALGEAGELLRQEGQVALALRAPIELTDPSIESSAQDAVLRALALRGDARARELAEDLSMPLRTVQQALARLLEDEECVRVGEGQAVSYRVEDTTFREPTRVG